MSKTIKSLIREAQENNSTILKFYDAEDSLNEIPKEIFELSNLEELHFNNKFPISKIPSDIKKLRKLKKLTISNTDLKEFPFTIMSLESLTELTLAFSGITELPTELNSWNSLTNLNIFGCGKLKNIIGLPPKLEYLDINGGGFSKFPKKIFELQELTNIIITSFKLKELPKQLYDLKKLESLNVGNNQLSNFPDDILKLTELKELGIDYNYFNSIPEVIFEIKSLITLNARSNNIENISSNICNLKRLTTLILGNNCFDEIPKSIFNLPKLQMLDFSNKRVVRTNYIARSTARHKNLIKTIPNELLSLENLTQLNLFRNPIENVPEEIIVEGLEAIKNFIRSKIEADSEEFLYEAKMVVVGRGDVGKTVLTKKLTSPDYSLTNSPTTKGIDILKNPFRFPMKGLKNTDNFRFNIWDFGGQEKYDATHQLFITNRSIYLFLTEARAESNYQDVFYWLNTVSVFSDNSPIIVVLSKCDERKKQLPESLYKNKFSNIVKFVDVSCADGYEHTIKNLKAAITQAITQLPQTKLTLSNYWVNIRSELEELSYTKDYISYTEYLAICKKNKLDKTRADFLSEYLNDLGVIIHHKNDLLLKKTVFINTDWCVDGMYKVMDDELVFKNKGKFSNNDLSKIWHEERFENKQPELIQLMCDYNLCFKLTDGSGYIAPDLLPPDKPLNIKWNYRSTLQFEYRYTFMPAGILSRFIVKSNSYIKDKIYWKYGVVLHYDNTEAIIEEDYINSKLKVSLKGENKKNLLAIIRMLVSEVHKDFDKANKLEFEEMVPCNCTKCINSSQPHFYKFDVLKKFEQKPIIEIPCEKSSEQVKIKSLINDVQIQSLADYLDTDNDLKHFILALLEDIVQKELSLKDGHLSFWRDKGSTQPKDETEVHPCICNTLDHYCKVRGVNLGREVKEANGNVDIVFSYTNRENQLLRVCVEIKKAHHQDVETAISTQLPPYLESAGTKAGIYLVIWYKNDSFKQPTKFRSPAMLQKAIDQNNPVGQNISVKIISCNKSTSPSKAKVKKKNIKKVL